MSLKQAIDLKSDFGEAYLERGRVLAQLRQLDFAVADLQLAVKSLGPGSIASADLGSALLKRGKPGICEPRGQQRQNRGRPAPA